MDRSVRAERTAATVCTACLLVLAFTVSSCSDKGTGFELLATASVRSSQVGYVATPDGPALYAGGSILRLKSGELHEIMRLADSYQLSVRALPRVFPMVSDQGAIYLEDGRLLLLRQAMRYDSGGQPVFDRYEVVLLSAADAEAPSESLFASQAIEGGLLMLEGRPPRVLAVGGSHDSTSTLLISHPVGGNGDAREWTRAVDGVVRVAAASPDGTLAIVRTRPTGVMVFESTLEVLRADDGTVVSSTALPAGESVAALSSYHNSESRLWLLETYTEDHTTQLATVFDGEFRYLESDRSSDSYLELLTTGELLANRPGDELVVRIVDRTYATGGLRLAVATVSGGRIKLLREVEEDGIASARIVDLDGDGQNEIACVQRVDGLQMTAISYPSRVCVVRLEGEEGYTAIHSEAYMDVGIESIDCGDLNGDDRQEVIVGYQVGTSRPEPHVDVLALR
ncbi:MAG: hypothetical protein ACYC1R_05540 [Coriobacteriia bacterium]